MNEIFDYLLKDNNIEYSLKLLSLSKKITKKLFNEINFFDLFLKKSKLFKEEMDKGLIDGCYNYIYNFYKLYESNNININFNIINDISIDILNLIKYENNQEKFDIEFINTKNIENRNYRPRGMNKIFNRLKMEKRPDNSFFIITFDKEEWENIIDFRRLDNHNDFKIINIYESSIGFEFVKVLKGRFSVIVSSLSLNMLIPSNEFKEGSNEYNEEIIKNKYRLKKYFLLNELKWEYHNNIKNKTIIFENILNSRKTNETIKYYNELIYNK